MRVINMMTNYERELGSIEWIDNDDFLETRQSGDGDSCTEFKEIGLTKDSLELRVRTKSRIPVRTSRGRNKYNMPAAQEVGDNQQSDLIKNTACDSHVDKSNGFEENVQAMFKDELNFKIDEIVATPLNNINEDIRDIYEDLQDVLVDMSEESEQIDSLSPRAPLALFEDNILEAPEEFRTTNEFESCDEDEVVAIEEKVEEIETKCIDEYDVKRLHTRLNCRDAAPGAELARLNRDHVDNSTPDTDTCGRVAIEEASTVLYRETVTGTADALTDSTRCAYGNEGCKSMGEVETMGVGFNSDQYALGDVVASGGIDNGQIERCVVIESQLQNVRHVELCDTLLRHERASGYDHNRRDMLEVQEAEEEVVVEGKVDRSSCSDAECTSTSKAANRSSSVVSVGLSGGVTDIDNESGREVLNGPSSRGSSSSSPTKRTASTAAAAESSASASDGASRVREVPTIVSPSIEIGVARCASAPGCSRVLDASVYATLVPNTPSHYSCDPHTHTTTTCISTDDHTTTTNKQIISTTNNNNNTPCETSGRSAIAQTNKQPVGFGFNTNGRLVFEFAEDESERVPETGLGQCSRLQQSTSNQNKTVPSILQVIQSCTQRIEENISRSVNKQESELSEQSLEYIATKNKISEQITRLKNTLFKEYNHHSQPHEGVEADVSDINRELTIDTNDAGVLLSKDLNKRTVESRLKHLEQKLKEAGITDDDSACISLTQFSNNFNKYSKYSSSCESLLEDVNADEVNVEGEKKQVVDKSADYDDNQNLVCDDTILLNTVDEEEDYIPDFSNGGCEFDVRSVAAFTGFGDGEFYVVYDELDDCSDEDCAEERVIRQCKMRGESNMGTDSDRRQHNPDRENLKSLLKKPGRGKDKKNRVVFNEKKNEFFDADYIILIREDCDYDEEEDDGVCTCNQHEMVRLTCCEPNCNCNVYEGYNDPTPQSPKFAPPLEFVDAVTLSPPEGYKDMELGEQQLLALQQMARRGQMAAVCKECSQTHDEEGEGSEEELTSDQEKEKTDQSQQTTPTTPPADNDVPNNQRYMQESPVVAMPTAAAMNDRRTMLKEVEDDRKESSPTPSIPPGGSPISGILKGGRLWKQQSIDINNIKVAQEPQQTTDSSITSDDEGGSKRSVRFIESDEEKRDSCDGAPEKPMIEKAKSDEVIYEQKAAIAPSVVGDNCNNSVSPDTTSQEMTLTFKLGNHVLISNNSLKPNSAVRQLFPCTKPLKPGDSEDSGQQYLVTAESLRAFEEAKRSKLPQIIQSGEADESIKRAIERNTLRRSLIRYEPRSKKNVQKTEASLEERIKLLTCDVDDPLLEIDDVQSNRASPPGEEARNSPDVPVSLQHNKNHDKSFSPSSSSTASSNSSVSSTYKKITDLFAKRDKPDIQNNVSESVKFAQSGGAAPDLGGPQEFIDPHNSISKLNTTSEARKQFLSTLAPLSACVSGTGAPDDYYYHMNNIGTRMSMASSVGTEYSLEDIDEGLKKDEEDSNKRIAPDVLAGTPSASESGDELAMFVQQDASRIERIKKKYQPDAEDDEHDDYGFNRRPSVRGIKPRFGSTTEILQQIQSQMQPPISNTPPRNPVAWPYYSETNLSGVDNKSRNINQQMPNYQYAVTEEMKRTFSQQQYRPTTLVEESIYQNCANQRCAQVTYRSNTMGSNMNLYSSPIVRVGGGCNEYYQSLPRSRNGRPLSPPPQEVKGYQTMVYIPYNHIEGYQPPAMSPNPSYYSSTDPTYSRVTNQNQINKRYVDPAYQARMSQEDHYATAKQVRVPYSGGVVMSRSESPNPGHFSTARATQTPQAATHSTSSYYPTNTATRYRPMVNAPNGGGGVMYVQQQDGNYVTKMNRHSFPAGGARYPTADNISLTDSDSQHSGQQIPNGYRQSVEISFSQKDSMPNSPTKSRFIERGVPEGAASVSPQDLPLTTSAMTSPTSPQNPQTTSKPLFYAMNV